MDKSINIPEFVRYVIPDEDGSWGTEGARMPDDAPQWAKEAYAEWKHENRSADENDFEIMN